MKAAVEISPVAVELDARNMFWAGYPLAEISRQLSINYNTLISWKNRDKWDEAPVIQRIQGALHARYIRLINKPTKTDQDFKELAAMGTELERMEKIKKYQENGNGAVLNPKLSKRRRGKKKDPATKNHLTDEHVVALRKAFDEQLFPHQREWVEAGLVHSIRNILKSRQIGATLTFSREAIVDAAEKGKNKLFISASRSQALVFRRNIIKFVREVTGVELKGDPLVLSNGAELHFLGTNKNTAQSYSGDLYIDECFWMPQFKDIEHVASGMAILDDRKITYFSTPSSKDHAAYKIWSGEHYNEGRPKRDHIHIDVSHKALINGRLCEDGHWRQIVNIEDAIAKGYTLVTLDKLHKKFPPAKFENLLMCKFVDTAGSVFTLSALQRCMVDSAVTWSDFNPLLLRPFATQEVWIGYDPSRSRDDASIVVIAPPRKHGGKFRLLEKLSMHNRDFEHQAAEIRSLCEKYNVTYIGIDTSGMGVNVYDLVRKFYPSARRIDYNVETKNRMVLKAQQIINRGRFEYDAADTDLALAFMTVHRTLTPSGKQISYKSARTATTGHADEAWAVMHVFDNEPIDFSDQATEGSGGFLEIFE